MAPKRLEINGRPHTKVGVMHRCTDGEFRPLYRDDAFPAGVMGATACPVADCTRHDRTPEQNEQLLTDLKAYVLEVMA